LVSLFGGDDDLDGTLEERHERHVVAMGGWPDENPFRI
jgi:hypothetical protein